MKAYTSIFKLRFINSLQYRVSAIAGMLTQICFGLMYIYLFKAFYAYGNQPTDFSLSQMCNYVWLQQALYALFALFAVNSEMTSAIVEGNVSYNLVRPIKLYNNWFVSFLSERLSKALMRGIPLIIFAIILSPSIGLTAPQNIWVFITFIVAIIIGALLCVALSMLAYALLFKTMTPNGVFSIFALIGSFCSGALVPIPIMPSILQKVLNYLPFRYTTDLPFRIYCSNLSISAGWIQIAISFGWLVLIILIGKLWFRKNLKKVEIQGG